MTIPRLLLKLVFDAYVVSVLILATQAFLPLLIRTDDPSASSQGSPFLKLAWGAVYLISGVRVFRRRQEFLQAVRANLSLVFLIGLAVASVLWSIDRASTLHAAASLVMSALFGVDIALSYPVKRQLQMIFVALILVISVSVIVEVMAPGLIHASDVEEGAWHGVFGFKNEFGRVICMGVVSGLCLSRSKGLKVLVVVGGLGLALLAKSAGALGYAGLMTLLYLTWGILKWMPKPQKIAIATLCVLGILAGVYISQNVVEVTGLFGKDPHLTGRTELWRMAVEDIQAKPVLGYGFQAFWNQDSQPARRIREAINWQDAPHAHNGFIDFGLSLGAVGLIVYGWMYVTLFFRGRGFYLGGDESFRAWPLTWVGLTLIYQFTESGFFSGNTLSWVTFCMIAFSLAPLKNPSAMRGLYVVPMAAV